MAIRRRAWLGLREARASCYRADPDAEQCKKRPTVDVRVKKRPINVEAVVARIAPKLSSDLRALAAAIRTLDLTELRQWGDLVESNLQKAAVLGGKVSANVRQANALTLTSSSSPAAQRLSGTTVSKETYYSVKRDLLQCQKRPTVSKETYYSVKDLEEC